jgi:hypothetical protein
MCKVRLIEGADHSFIRFGSRPFGGMFAEQIVKEWETVVNGSASLSQANKAEAPKRILVLSDKTGKRMGLDGFRARVRCPAVEGARHSPIRFGRLSPEIAAYAFCLRLWRLDQRWRKDQR